MDITADQFYLAHQDLFLYKVANEQLQTGGDHVGSSQLAESRPGFVWSVLRFLYIGKTAGKVGIKGGRLGDEGGTLEAKGEHLGHEREGERSTVHLSLFSLSKTSIYTRSQTLGKC